MDECKDLSPYGLDSESFLKSWSLNCVFGALLQYAKQERLK